MLGYAMDSIAIINELPESYTSTVTISYRAEHRQSNKKCDGSLHSADVEGRGVDKAMELREMAHEDSIYMNVYERLVLNLQHIQIWQQKYFPMVKSTLVFIVVAIPFSWMLHFIETPRSWCLWAMSFSYVQHCIFTYLYMKCLGDSRVFLIIILINYGRDYCRNYQTRGSIWTYFRSPNIMPNNGQLQKICLNHSKWNDHVVLHAVVCHQPHYFLSLNKKQPI